MDSSDKILKSMAIEDLGYGDQAKNYQEPFVAFPIFQNKEEAPIVCS
jgi:hypothetical protein